MSTVVGNCTEPCTHEQLQRLLNFNRHVVHDLRAPLVSVVGAVEQAQAALARGDVASAVGLLSMLATRANGMAQLVSELMHLSTARDAPIAFERVELTDIARSAIDETRQAGLCPHAAEVRLDPLPPALGSAALLKQVFVNLLSNAIKFTSSAAAPRIEIGVEGAPDGGPHLFVRDNGVGFDVHQAHRLFEPFSRLHGARYPGHGLGLNVVKCVVERHGGRVWATSAAAQGATFRFTLGALLDA